MGTTISSVVTTAKNAMTPAISFIGKHWKSLLIGGICVYSLVISIAFFSIVSSANNASAKSKLDAIATAKTIAELTDNLTATKASLAKSEKLAGQQQELIRQSGEDNKRLDDQNKQLATNQSGITGSNTSAIELNGRAISIINDLIKGSK